MGVELGDTPLMPMQGVNEKGFFEDIDFMSLNSKLLFHTVDLHFHRMSREAELTQSEGARHKARQMKEMELQLIRLADITTVVSTYELSILRKELPDYKIRLLPFARLPQSFKKVS